MPGAPLGLQAEDPTIATALKAQGYATGQFGKNHLGDRDEFLPTMHGFDEFFGNLYHLNAEEEPENVDYPKDPEFRKKFGPRGVLHTWANGDGTQRIEDTGPLTKKRMETCDEEFRDAAIDFIKRQHEADTPVLRLVQLDPHALPHPSQAGEHRPVRPVAVRVPRHDARPRRHRRRPADHTRRTRHRRQHDRHVLHRQRPAHEQLARRGHDAVPQREELELGRRLPGSGHRALARSHPGRHRAERNRQPQRLVRHPAGRGRRTDIAEKLRTGTDLNGTTYKVHLDGHNQLDYITGAADESPRKHFFYVSDDGDLTALRFDNWKIVFMEQRQQGTLKIWLEPYVVLRGPKLFNLRTDPYERADITSNTYYDWMFDRVFVFTPAQAYVARACCRRSSSSRSGRSRRASTSSR